MARHRGVILYLVMLALASGTFVAIASSLGQSVNAVAGLYMFTPALAALVARLCADRPPFHDAGLRIGLWRDLGWAWLLGVTGAMVSVLVFLVAGAISIDLSGQGFLDVIERFAPGQGRAMVEQLPAGWTLREMLLAFTLGGLTVFNVPSILLGFGEEFGWRGYLFPRLWRIRPWLAIVGGGLLWFGWHVPLVLLMPGAAPGCGEMALRVIAGGVGCVAMGVVFAHAYAASGSIWVPSLLHIAFNNASRSFSYWITVENQPLGDALLALVVITWAVWLWRTGRLDALRRFGSPGAELGPSRVHRE